MSNSLNFFTIYTLVDITSTGVTRPTAGSVRQRNQQRNWDTVLQVFGIRAQPVYIKNPVVQEIDLKNTEFGSNFHGIANVWVACVGVEHADVHYSNGNPILGLVDDFNNVPVICNLAETVTFSPRVFSCQAESKNIYFKFGQTELNTIDATQDLGIK